MRCLTAVFPLARDAKPERVARHSGRGDPSPHHATQTSSACSNSCMASNIGQRTCTSTWERIDMRTHTLKEDHRRGAAVWRLESGQFGAGHGYRPGVAVRAVSMVPRASVAANRRSKPPCRRDTTVCHTYWKVGPNHGNVGPYVWNGPNPPGHPPSPPPPPLWVP
jgi:hypothetical protein